MLILQKRAVRRGASPSEQPKCVPSEITIAGNQTKLNQI